MRRFRGINTANPSHSRYCDCVCIYLQCAGGGAIAMHTEHREGPRVTQNMLTNHLMRTPNATVPVTGARGFGSHLPGASSCTCQAHSGPAKQVVHVCVFAVVVDADGSHGTLARTHACACTLRALSRLLSILRTLRLCHKCLWPGAGACKVIYWFQRRRPSVAGRERPTSQTRTECIGTDAAVDVPVRAT